ncbi:AAA family ATPase [Streptomyces sp. NPDC087228]|uniref:AAA family ATPase n=1 Tax=Streptomyces sp. NPDC087228 TaxID=3365772 RepID=UPI00381EE33B
MTNPDQQSSQQLAHKASHTILDQLPQLTQRGLVVDSPPGAGKTTLVVQAAEALAQTGIPCIVIAQTNSQVDDLVRRLAASPHNLKIARLTGQDYTLPDDLLMLPRTRISTRINGLETAHVIIGTAMKWATVRDRQWPWAIIDEAYQMRSDVLLLTARLFDKALFVGDPGQLDPFSTVQTRRWQGLAYDPMSSAVAVLLDKNPNLPVHTLPVSWRLPPSAIPLISDAFYPFTPFHAGTRDADRALTFTTAGIRSPYDPAIEHAAQTGWALMELPARYTQHTDTEALHTTLGIAERLLTRATCVTDETEPQPRPLRPRDIAVGVAHRGQARHLRLLLAQHYPRLQGVTIDTANRLQGHEFSVTIVLHPLSGRSDASAFHLEAGRLCVLTTRHRHTCIVVARAGIAQLLDAHPSNEPEHLGATTKLPDGWEANHTVLEHLAQHAVGPGQPWY